MYENPRTNPMRTSSKQKSDSAAKAKKVPEGGMRGMPIAASAKQS